MAFEIQPWNVYIGLAIVGLFSGLGSAAGNYLFNRLIKERIDKLRKGKHADN